MNRLPDHIEVLIPILGKVHEWVEMEDEYDGISDWTFEWFHEDWRIGVWYDSSGDSGWFAVGEGFPWGFALDEVYGSIYGNDEPNFFPDELAKSVKEIMVELDKRMK